MNRGKLNRHGWTLHVKYATQRLLITGGLPFQHWSIKIFIAGRTTERSAQSILIMAGLSGDMFAVFSGSSRLARMMVDVVEDVIPQTHALRCCDPGSMFCYLGKITRFSFPNHHGLTLLLLPCFHASVSCLLMLHVSIAFPFGVLVFLQCILNFAVCCGEDWIQDCKTIST